MTSDTLPTALAFSRAFRYDVQTDARLGVTFYDEKIDELAMAQFGLSEEEAKRRVENTDRARAQYYRRYTDREYGSQKWYHLGLDSGLLGTEESVESIVNILRRWCDVRGTHPLYMI